MSKMPNLQASECECGTLEQHSREPSIPIVFDAALNEYHIVGTAGQQVMINYCHFCGGRAPASRRDENFHNLDHQEQMRLIKVIGGLKTLADVMDRFGAADFDVPNATFVTERADAVSPKTTYFRQMIYRGLSDTADVHVVVGLNDVVQFSFSPKSKV